MAFNLLRPKEKFLILEITPKGTSGLFLSTDENRNLVFEKLEKKINIKKFLRSPSRAIAQRSWEGQYFFKSHRKIIAAADSSLATTIPVPLDLKREPHAVNEKITMVEFENLIAQAMAMIFNQCRSEAGRRLNAQDIHTILVASKASGFKVDQRRVQNPVDCSGKVISLLLELTFTKRELFEELKPLFAAPEEFFFAESPQVRLVSAARVRRLPLALISANDEGAFLYVLTKMKNGHDILYREKLAWSFSSIFAVIQKDFHVSAATARELYSVYCQDKVSAPVAHVFKKIVEPSMELFFSEIKKAKIGGSVYVDSPYEMPFRLPYHHPGINFEKSPIDDIFSELDFSADMKAFADRPEFLFRYCAPFLEAYFDKGNSVINQKLRHRLHWLAQ